MIDIELDETTHDLRIAGFDLSLVSGTDETVQHVKQRLLTFEGEWFLDLAAGVPWFDQILGKPRDVRTVEALLKAEILASPGVRSLSAFAISPINGQERSVRVDFTMQVGNNPVATTVELTI